jgi:hypothetical protein
MKNSNYSKWLNSIQCLVFAMVLTQCVNFAVAQQELPQAPPVLTTPLPTRNAPTIPSNAAPMALDPPADEDPQTEKNRAIEKKNDQEREQRELENAKRDAQSKSSAATTAASEEITIECLSGKNYNTGAVLIGKLSINVISIETEYGKLDVPVTSIISFTPGMSSHPELNKQVNAWIKDLGSSNFNDRETAQRELTKIVRLIRPELERLTADPDTERRNRIQKILAESEEFDSDADDQTPKTALNQRDTIVTKDFPIVGKIVPQTFHIATDFGPQTVPLASIRRAFRLTPKKDDFRKTVSVDAKNLSNRALNETGIRLDRGDKVIISAKGNLTMMPWGGNAVVSPEGSTNYGWFVDGQIAVGALVGKIGSDQFFKIGTKHEFVADRSGMLNLGIAMQNSYDESQFRGKFTVDVKVIKKQ